MKNILISFFLLTNVSFLPLKKTGTNPSSPVTAGTGNVFIITIDGFRWQEVFQGADSALISDEGYTPDTGFMKMLYWASTIPERRKKLLPFFWNILAAKGQLYGNRIFDNKVNVANIYSISYPGYNEIFTGTNDMNISTNNKYQNPNINILEYLDSKPAFKGRVAAFTSWDVFPYILNAGRNDVLINSGYTTMKETIPSLQQAMINKVQEEAVYEKTATRYDELTFLTAKEYIRHHRPRVVFLGLGETDEMAHQKRYDLYLEQANKTDRMIAELWHWVQTTPGYKNNTTFIITTDHGRGRKNEKWASHGEFIRGSSQTWLAVIGPGISPGGEIKEGQQLYQQQLAQTITRLLGEEFDGDNIAPAISLR
ncbi:MAG: alkaline phosphatase family protein [Ferruginibacter sp.]|nr:alkaline phosphatase family protein [Chitinophagaceae bacterium]